MSRPRGTVLVHAVNPCAVGVTRKIIDFDEVSKFVWVVDERFQNSAMLDLSVALRVLLHVCFAQHEPPAFKDAVNLMDEFRRQAMEEQER